MSRIVGVHGRGLNVVESGDPMGAPVVLLHTGLGSVADWREQMPVLADAGYRVVAYDRWGYGRSEPRIGFAPPDFQDDVEDLGDLLNALGIDMVSLVGHSDGGSIALELAAMAPDRVRGVVTVAAHIYLELKMLPGIRALERRFEGEPAFRSALERRHGPATAAIARDWFAGWQRREAWLWDMRPLLPLIDCPTLVVQGLDDEHATPQHARDIAAGITGAELELAPAAGHMVPQALPDAFNTQLLSFLNRNSS